MVEKDFGLEKAFKRELKRELKSLENEYRKRIEELHRNFLNELERFEKTLRTKYEKLMRREEKRYLSLLMSKKKKVIANFLDLLVQYTKEKVIKRIEKVLGKKYKNVKIYRDFIVVEKRGEADVIDIDKKIEEVIEGEDILSNAEKLQIGSIFSGSR